MRHSLNVFSSIELLIEKQVCVHVCSDFCVLSNVYLPFPALLANDNPIRPGERCRGSQTREQSMKWPRSRVCSNAAFGPWATAESTRPPAAVCRSLLRCKITPASSVFLSARSGLPCLCPKTEDRSLFISLKPSFKSGTFAYACREGPSYWRGAGKSVRKAPGEERARGRQSVVQRKG